MKIKLRTPGLWFVFAACAVLVAATVLSGPGATTHPAKAAFPGQKGKIAISTDEFDGNAEIYTMNPDGSALANLTNNPARDTSERWRNGSPSNGANRRPHEVAEALDRVRLRGRPDYSSAS